MKRTKPLRRTPLKRSAKPIRMVSKKRAKDMKTYALLRQAFLKAHPYCQWAIAVMGQDEEKVKESGSYELSIPEQRHKDDRSFFIDVWPPQKPVIATDIHHKAGRTGSNYLNTDTWMAVSRKGHEYIHENMNRARAWGWVTS